MFNITQLYSALRCRSQGNIHSAAAGETIVFDTEQNSLIQKLFGQQTEKRERRQSGSGATIPPLYFALI